MSFASPVVRWTLGSIGLGLSVGGAWAAASVFREGLEAASASRVTVGIALLILGLPLLILPTLLASGMVPDKGGPWVQSLARLAAEHGQQVQSEVGVGVWFDIVHGGPRFTVLVDPVGHRLLLKSRRNARHGVVVLRRGERGEADNASWVEVARGEAWSMRAEVRVAAAAMAQNAALAHALDRFFAFRGAVSVSFGADGLALELRLPAPESTPDVIRAGMDVARSVWHASER